MIGHVTLKEKILLNFDRAARSYDSVAHVQKASAHHLVSLISEYLPLGKFPPSPKILDVGAGTGFVTESLYGHFAQACFTLNDIAPQMLDSARKKLAHIPSLMVQEGDAEITRFLQSPYDLIASNLAFQWFNSWQDGLQNLLGQTRCLAFSTLMEGTFQDWQTAHAALGLPSGTHAYPSCELLLDYVQSLEATVIFTGQKTFTLSFGCGLEFIRYLKALGANAPRFPYSLTALNQLLRSLKEPFSVSYRIFYCILENESI